MTSSLLRSIAFVSVALVLPIAAFADKAPPRPANAKADLSPAETARFVAFFNKMIDIVVADQDDCPKMATDLNAHVDANKALVEELQKVSETKGLPKDAKDKIEARASKELEPAMKKCMADKGVQAAFDRFSKKVKSTSR